MFLQSIYLFNICVYTTYIYYYILYSYYIYIYYYNILLLLLQYSCNRYGKSIEKIIRINLTCLFWQSSGLIIRVASKSINLKMLPFTSRPLPSPLANWRATWTGKNLILDEIDMGHGCVFYTNNERICFTNNQLNLPFPVFLCHYNENELFQTAFDC